MTEDEWILARLQVEREQQMSGWRVPGPHRDRRLPIAPRRALEAEEQKWRARQMQGAA